MNTVHTNQRFCEICEREIMVEELAVEFGDGIFICHECWDERPDGIEMEA